MSSTATLTIHVLDADDQYPEFSAKTYKGSIREDATTVRPRKCCVYKESYSMSFVVLLSCSLDLIQNSLHLFFSRGHKTNLRRLASYTQNYSVVRKFYLLTKNMLSKLFVCSKKCHKWCYKKKIITGI